MHTAVFQHSGPDQKTNIKNAREDKYMYVLVRVARLHSFTVDLRIPKESNPGGTMILHVYKYSRISNIQVGKVEKNKFGFTYMIHRKKFLQLFHSTLTFLKVPKTQLSKFKLTESVSAANRHP